MPHYHGYRLVYRPDPNTLERGCNLGISSTPEGAQADIDADQATWEGTGDPTWQVLGPCDCEQQVPEGR